MPPRWTFLVAMLAAVVLGWSGLQSPAQGTQETFPASEQPLANTARVLDGHVYGIASNGTTVVVVGDFTTVRDYAYGSPEQTRNYVMAYDAATGAVSQTFAPVVDGPVNAVHFTDDGSRVLIAGLFKNVNGTPHRGIARLNLDDGSLDPTFEGHTSNGVLDMAVTGDEVIVGGYFDFAGGQPRQRLAALDPQTGMAIPGFDFTLSGILNPRNQGQRLQVRQVDVSPDGKWLVIVGNQTEVNGVPRSQVALIDLDTYTVADWSAPALGGWPCHASSASVTWVLDAGFSPDSRYLVTGSTGGYRRRHLCDTVARFELPPVSSGSVSPTWVDYTGGDSVYKVKATGAAVYAGGHQRWFNNSAPSVPDGGLQSNNDGPGAVNRYGLGALDPTSGVPLSWFPNRDGARPKRGFQAIETPGDVLLLGSDSNEIGGEVRQRVAAFSTADGTPNPPPEQVALPVNLYVLGADDVLSRTSYDGSTFGKVTPVSGPGYDGADWSTLRDGFVQRGALTAFGNDGAYYRRSFDSTVGAPTNLSSTVGYTDDGALTRFDQPYGVQQTKAAAYSGGRIIYTRRDSTKLYWRWYSLESGIIGSREYVLNGTRAWNSHVRALEVIGSDLYVATKPDKLVRYRLAIRPTSVHVRLRSRVVVDRGAAGINWGRVRGLFATPAGSPSP